MSGPGQGWMAVSQFSEAENSSANRRKVPCSLRGIVVEHEVTLPREDIEQKRIAEAVFKANEKAIESTKKEQANQKLVESGQFQLTKYYIQAAIKLISSQTSSNSQKDATKLSYSLAASLVNTVITIIEANNLGADHQLCLDEWSKVPGSEKYLNLKEGVTADGGELLIKHRTLEEGMTKKKGDRIGLLERPMFVDVKGILNGSSQKNKEQGLSTAQPGQRFSPYPSHPPRSASASKGGEGSSHVQPQSNVGRPISGRKGR